MAKAKKRLVVELRLKPFVEKQMTCLRCGAHPCAIVPNVDPATGRLRGVGLGQHAMLCSELCEKRPWTCPKCDGVKVPEHTRWCTVAHPEYRAKWEADRAGFGGDMLRLATMLAMREEMLPAFLMEMLFDPELHAHVDLGMGSHF